MSKGILVAQFTEGCPLPPEPTLRLAAGDAPVTFATNRQDACKLLDEKSWHLFITNHADIEVLRHARSRHSALPTILVTALPMKEYSEALQGEEENLVAHVIASRQGSVSTIHELRITMQKLLRGDIFGIEKYLGPQTVIHRATIKGSRDREIYNRQVMEFAESCQVGQHMAKVIYGITEELLMNTVHDAPVAAGRSHYLSIPRTEPLELEPDEYGELSYGCDGQFFAVSTSDPFGALPRATLMKYARKILLRRDSTQLIDTKKGGAGLGFFKILYSSHGLICNVAPQKRTEIMALIDLQEPLRDFARMARSIHYFQSP